MTEFRQDMELASAEVRPDRLFGTGASDADRLPLVVDLDGTLIKTDLLYESFLDVLSHNFRQVFSLALLRSFSKQALKAHLAGFSRIDYARLPFNEKVLELIGAEKGKGRKVYLATASDRIHADGVAAALGLFDGVFASDETVNLKADSKAEALVEAFGEKGFDYVGNDESDRAIWVHARRAYSIGLPGGIEREVGRTHPDHVVLDKRRLDVRALIKALRPHQYAKNGLIFVPLLTAHQFTLAAATQALLAFVAFSICASGVYLLNDLLDIQADRGHPTKCRRPLAAGRLSIRLAMALVPVLTLSAFAIAWFISPLFFLALGIYYIVTNAYSFSLKKRLIADVVALAMLYTIRVFAGAAAIGVVVSEWLFTFSLLIFTALALVKRHVELSTRLDKGLEDPTNRNYKITDLPVITALAASAGMNSVMVLALYVSSDDVARMYSRPHILWGLCPLFLYWIARVVMLAHRRHVDDDPIAFALKDDRSWTIGLLSLALILAAL